MNNVLLLTGKPRTGKSTAIRKTIEWIGPNKCGGFYTEEIRDDVDRIGFRCVTVAGESIEVAHIDSTSPLRVGRYGVMIEPFEQIAIRSVQQSLQHGQVTVIDEIGPMQMLSAPFRELVERLIADPPHIVLGTVCLDAHPVIDKIKNGPGVTVYHLEEHNRDTVPGLLANEIAKRLR
ncbi:nucleoside-triphosphatase [Paenibacillus allorhizosphaerae]|uniref:Nucleoside-triphosphatase THEP1 n=1 Tax=Paenibacillus allorhizosphaerae TaxID=2849866 RepID=A0ABN7TNK7_9BACL|nr:nucleoside-triphosphatase [Paenibacillus allorhizosphaerae]CAG7636159.1 Nucleoside-triphosphatase THEP1 [Paenibacillus allorhizosphaerae]